MDILANIDESELEDLLHDPEFLNIDPNLPPDVRRRKIEELRFALFFFLKFWFSFKHFNYSKKHTQQRIANVPPLSKDILQEIDDPLDYLYKYCIIQLVCFFFFLFWYVNLLFCLVLIVWLIMNVYF